MYIVNRIYIPVYIYSHYNTEHCPGASYPSKTLTCVLITLTKGSGVSCGIQIYFRIPKPFILKKRHVSYVLAGGIHCKLNRCTTEGDKTRQNPWLSPILVFFRVEISNCHSGAVCPLLVNHSYLLLCSI